ncbi:n-6 DNA methylase [Clostridium sp. CAG:288]|mgnify:FL=1|nr:n-6 DNA methylase [Clostridium sp. CAG:288]
MKINYAEMILALRVKLNISQQQLGDMLGVSFSTVNRWEKGHHEPTILAKERLKSLFKENCIEAKEVK